MILQMTADEVIVKIKEKRDLESLDTQEDVRFVLTEIAPPGKERELKTEVISRLFRKTSPQGVKTAQTLTSYPEY